MNYKKMTIDDIIDWCVKNNQTEWLKKIASKKVPYEVYPRIKNAEGKSVADKTQKPIRKMRKISFVQIKSKFVEEFMPEIKPEKKAKEENMFDRINAL